LILKVRLAFQPHLGNDHPKLIQKTRVTKYERILKPE